MQNFNHSNGNDNQRSNNSNQNNSSQNNRVNNNQSDGVFSKIINWGVSLAVKYGKTFEIVIWSLTIIGILFIPILAVAMTYFAYCYSKVNPNRGHIMMAVALVGGIISWILYGKSNNDSSDGTVWYYFWTE